MYLFDIAINVVTCSNGCVQNVFERDILQPRVLKEEGLKKMNQKSSKASQKLRLKFGHHSRNMRHKGWSMCKSRNQMAP